MSEVTIDEYRKALDQLTDQQFAQFKGRFGGAANRRRIEAVDEFACSPEPERWDRIIVMHLRALGVQWVQTESEKAGAIAERSAAAAEASARAAAESEKHARCALRASWWAVGVALLGSVVTIALARGC